MFIYLLLYSLTKILLYSNLTILTIPSQVKVKREGSKIYFERLQNIYHNFYVAQLIIRLFQYPYALKWEIRVISDYNNI
jgi:hypothetical protein